MNELDSLTRVQSQETPLVPPRGAGFKSPGPLQFPFPEDRRVPAPTAWKSAKLDIDIRLSKLDADQSRKEFERLDKKLQTIGGKVVVTLDKVIPLLSDMQCLLSQRGDKRHKADLMQAKLPVWGAYAQEYADKFGVVKRTIFRKIAAYRGLSSTATANTKTRPKHKHIVLTTKQARQAMKALTVANEIVEAAKLGGPLQAHLSEWSRVAFTPQETLAVLEGIEDEPLEKIMIPVLANALGYIRALEDALYYAADISEDRKMRVGKFRDKWRTTLPTAGYVYEVAKKAQANAA